ncbi:lysophospholipid acyltransferase family protein [Thermodesulfobacteriota bacterium]
MSSSLRETVSMRERWRIGGIMASIGFGRRDRKAIRRRIQKWTLFQVVRAVVNLAKLIPYETGVRLGGLGSRVVGTFMRKDRSQALSQLRLALGTSRSDHELKTMVREMYANLGRGLFEFINFGKIRHRVEEYVQIEGLEHLDEAMAEGRGVLWVTGHIGNWEIMANRMALLGYPINVVARSMYGDRLNDYMVNWRASNGINTIIRNRSSSGREILRAIRGNEILALLIDQDTSVQSVKVDFFGIKARTPLAAASLALKKGCVLLPGFIRRIDSCRHRITILPPHELIETGDLKADIVANTQALTTVIEKTIRECPAEWVWMHRRWQT